MFLVACGERRISGVLVSGFLQAARHFAVGPVGGKERTCQQRSRNRKLKKRNLSNRFSIIKLTVSFSLFFLFLATSRVYFGCFAWGLQVDARKR
jgi:hypothetical protein